MAKTKEQNHKECVDRFIDLANALKDEGVDINIVSGSLMTASCIYGSYAVGGNDGGLTESGVDKVAAVYKRELARVQTLKKQNTSA
jgi:hypothetical protein